MRLIIIAIVLSGFCSCKVIERKIYSPTQINNPSLQKKNDHSFGLSYSTPSGFDLTGGYAITNRLAVIGGAYSYKNRATEEQFSVFSNDSASARLLYRHKGFHAGIGVFFPLSRTSTASFISFFAGYTQGSFRMDERYFENTGPPAAPTGIYFYKSNIGRYFLQGSINGYTKNFEMSFISRFNYVGYSHVITNYSSQQQYDYNLPLLGYPKYSQFLDFAFDTKIYLPDNPRWGLQIFGGLTTRLNRKDFNFFYYPSRLGIGIVVKNPFKKKG